MLAQDEKRELLSIAREAIGRSLHVHRYAGQVTPVDVPREFHGRLEEPGGAFVTLRIDHKLRGCIGYIESSKPLADVVAEVAVKAALEDPRFSPLTPAEFHQVSVEVSVLSPLREVTETNEIEVGIHGLLLELGRRRGLLLPQVAVEYHWDRETFLDNTARKAGLPPTAWRDPEAKIYVFSADIVQEEEISAEGEPQ